MGEVSDVVDDDNTTVVDDDTIDDDDETSDDDDKTVDAVFFRDARDIMNRVRRKVGTAAREDRRFREHFGAPLRSCKWCGICWRRGGCSPRRASRSIFSERSIFLSAIQRRAPVTPLSEGQRVLLTPRQCANGCGSSSSASAS